MQASAVPPRRGSVDERVEAARLEVLRKNLPVAAGVTLSVSAMLAALSSAWAPTNHVWAWLILIWLVTLLRAGALLPRTSSASTMMRRFQLSVFLSGSTWGSAAILLFPESSVADQAIMTTVLAGMLVGSVSVYGVVLRTFLAFAVPLILPLMLRLAWFGDQVHLTLSALCGVFLVALALVSIRSGRQALAALELQFVNENMVVSLEGANTRMAKLNETLRNEVWERRRVEEKLRGYQKSLVQAVQHRTEELSVTTDRLEREVSERKRVEQELERAEKLRALGVLAGGIAHDFNNLLAIIMSNVGLLAVKTEQGDQVREYTDAACAALEQARELTTQLLTFSQGGAPLRTVVEVQSLLTQAQLMTVNTRCYTDVSASPDVWRLHADKGQLIQVLNNLALNAVQAMPDGGVVRLRVQNTVLGDDSLLPLPPGRYVQIVVQDEGEGIGEADLPRIFDPYFTTKETGTGLGLSVCHSVITRHGGHISVRSAAGEGARFDVWLPAHAEEEARTEALETAATSTDFSSLRVLVMDDDEAVRKSLLAIFRHLGCEVEGSADGAQAIDMAQSAQLAGAAYGLIVLDLTVPGAMGGREAAPELRRLLPGALLVASSGYSHDPVIADPSAHGFHGALRKPYSIGELKLLLNSLLSGRRPSAGPVA